MQFSPHRSKKQPASIWAGQDKEDDDNSIPSKFGDKQTTDHLVMSKHEQSVRHDTVALGCLDRGTRWMDFFPAVAKSTACTYKALQSFNGTVKPKLIFSDNSGEIAESCEQLGYSHDTCTPHRHQSNGVAERCHRRCKEGTACQLVQSGFMAAWWHLAMRHYCFLYNVTEKCVNRGPAGFITPFDWCRCGVHVS